MLHQNLLEFCRLGELNEVLGPIALGDEWLRDLAGLRRCLRACARAGHRKPRRPKSTRLPGGCTVKQKQSAPGSSGHGRDLGCLTQTKLLKHKRNKQFFFILDDR